MNAPVQIPPYVPPPAPFAGPGAAPPPASRPGRGLAILLLVLGVAATGLGSYILWYATRFSFVREDELMQAAAVGGAGLVLLALGLQRLLRGTRGWLVAALVFLVPAALAAFVILRAMSASDAETARIAARDALFDRLLPVCTGTSGIPDAAAYDRAPGPHPTAFFTIPSDPTEVQPYGWESDSSEGSAWMPKSVAETQLVACVTTEKELLESCAYDTVKGERYLGRVRYKSTIVLYEARTRTELARGSLEGSEPPGPCPETATFGEYDTFQDLAGTIPADAPLVGLVRPWIEVGPQGLPAAAP